MAAHPALQTMLTGQIVALEAHRRALTAVEYVSDPDHAGRTAVTISGPSKAGVQAEITRCMERAESMGNSAASFLNPRMQRDGSWRSVGEVIIAPAVVG
jgi:hypothetical protein